MDPGFSLRRLAAALAAAGAVGFFAPACHADARTQWDFVVRLDGERIGTHRFVVSRHADGTATVASDAHFEVRVLGWTAYRYVHRSRESWAHGCLAALDAKTDDDGRVTRVRAARTGAGLTVDAKDAEGDETAAETVPGCAMSFAYWNAALRTQRQLLDPGTGRLVDVRITPLAPERVETDRGPVDAGGWRIAGLPNAIDVRWHGGEWVGLDTAVAGGRLLTYRLR
jgi:hypothetical protein